MKTEHLKDCCSHPDSKHYHQPCSCQELLNKKEIKFRAKSLDGIWFHWKLSDPIDMETLGIDWGTVGQYTGLKDKKRQGNF